MSKKIIVAAVFSLLASAGLASEVSERKPDSQPMTMPLECTCATGASTATQRVRKTDKVTAVVVKQPKVQSNIDLHPEDYR